MKKIISIFLLSVMLVGIIPTKSYANEEELQLYAQSAVLMDGESGRILYAKNGQEAKANASTTKILACIVALEYGNTEDIAAASKEAAKQPAVHLGVRVGEEYRVLDMLYALMLESYNDAAVIIAEHISGSVKNFASLMNEKAKEIGCKDTYFVTANGLDAEDGYQYHHSTAEDLALILRYAMLQSPKKDEYLEITRKPNHSFTDVSGKRSFECNNRNKLLDIMSEAVTGKTGFTNKAGYCYVGAIESEGRTYIATVLASGWPNNRTYRWSDCEVLFEYGMNNYHYVSIDSTKNGFETFTSYVTGGKTVGDGLGYDMTLNIKSSDEIKVLKNEEEEVEMIVEYQTQLRAPIEKGTIVGSVRYMIGDEVWKVDPIITSEDIEKSDYLWDMTRWWKRKFI